LLVVPAVAAASSAIVLAASAARSADGSEACTLASFKSCDELKTPNTFPLTEGLAVVTDEFIVADVGDSKKSPVPSPVAA
jgi:hypothetical protein